jgi:hypothetical protein
MPYPNVFDTRVKLKRDYNDALRRLGGYRRFVNSSFCQCICVGKPFVVSISCIARCHFYCCLPSISFLARMRRYERCFFKTKQNENLHFILMRFVSASAQRQRGSEGAQCGNSARRDADAGGGGSGAAAGDATAAERSRVVFTTGT